MIPEHLIDEVRQRADIVDVVSRYVDLKRSGKNFKGLCPFHSEKTPSFNVSPDLQIFKCFGCGVGGNVFHFIQKIENLSFIEAVKRVADEVGVVITQNKGARMKDEEWARRKAALDLAQKVCSLYEKALLQNWSALKDYLGKRGLKRDDLKKFRIGFAPGTGKYLLKHLTDEEQRCAQQLGLIKEGKGGYDFFRNRLIFPICDSRGQVVGFSGRILNPEDHPKYINTPNNLIFDKGKILYGYHLARRGIHFEDKTLFIVEGYTDVIAFHRAGIVNTVASMGTALTPEQIRLIERVAEKVIFVYDSDEAGLKAMERGIERLLKFNLDLYICVLPDSMDPDEFVRSLEREDALTQLKGRSVDYVEFLFKRIRARFDSGKLTDRVKIIEHMIPILRQIENLMKRRIYADAFAKELGVDLSVWPPSLLHRRVERPQFNVLTDARECDVLLELFKVLVGSDESVVQFVYRFLPDEMIPDENYRKVYRMLVDQYREQGCWDMTELLNRETDERQAALLTEIQLNPLPQQTKRMERALFLLKKLYNDLSNQKIKEYKEMILTLNEIEKQEKFLRKIQDLNQETRRVLQAIEERYHQEVKKIK